MKNKNTSIVHTNFNVSTEIVLSMSQLTLNNADQHFRSWVKFWNFKLLIIIIDFAIISLLRLYSVRGSKTTIANTT